MAANPVRWPDETALAGVPGPGGPPSVDPPPPAGFAAFPVAVDPASPRAARRFAHTTLTGWGLHSLVDDVTVVISELVTNALRHGVGAWVPPSAVTVPSSSPLATQPVLASLVRRGDVLLCAVFDPGHGVPVVRYPPCAGDVERPPRTTDLADRWATAPPDDTIAEDAALDALESALLHGDIESGRGLQVVGAVSRAWGWTTPDHSGKAVWAMFTTSPDAVPRRLADAPRCVELSHPGARPDDEWDPVARLLLLMEILSDPPRPRRLAHRDAPGATPGGA